MILAEAASASLSVETTHHRGNVARQTAAKQPPNNRQTTAKRAGTARGGVQTDNYLVSYTHYTYLVSYTHYTYVNRR